MKRKRHNPEQIKSASSAGRAAAQTKADLVADSVGLGVRSQYTAGSSSRRNDSSRPETQGCCEAREYSAQTIVGQRRLEQGMVKSCRGKLLSRNDARRAVVVLQDRFRVSQRRPAVLTGQNRTPTSDQHAL